jgi:hypothetical protein
VDGLGRAALARLGRKARLVLSQHRSTVHVLVRISIIVTPRASTYRLHSAGGIPRSAANSRQDRWATHSSDALTWGWLVLWLRHVPPMPTSGRAFPVALLPECRATRSAALCCRPALEGHRVVPSCRPGRGSRLSACGGRRLGSVTRVVCLALARRSLGLSAMPSVPIP